MKQFWISIALLASSAPVTFALQSAPPTFDESESAQGKDDENQHDYSLSPHRLRMLLSTKPAVAQQEISRAIEHRDGVKILLYGYIGCLPEVRQEALRYYVELETDQASTFRSTLTEIAKEKETRLREIETAAGCIEEPVAQKGLPRENIKINLDQLFSPDPELAIEELKRAIHGRATAEIMLCAIVGNHQDARVLAQSHLIKTKLASREELKVWVETISIEIERRLGEIDLLDKKLRRSPG